MAVIVDQQRLGGASHSTVGTITDIARLLEILNRLVDAGNTVMVIEHTTTSFAAPTGSSTWVQKAATKAAK